MTSLAELLDEIAPRAWSDLLAGTADAQDACHALAQAGALLERLSDGLPAWGAGTTQQRDRTLNDVVHRCRAVHTARVMGDSRETARPDMDSVPVEANRGRLSELMAAATDLVSTMNPPLSPGERWAACAVLVDPICACAGVLREVEPSATIVDLDASLRQLRWWVRTRPAPGPDVSRLDQARPATVVDHGAGSSRLQQLIDVVAYAVETSSLEPYDGRVAAAAGLHIAVYAKAVMTSIGGGDADAGAACDAMTSTWLGLRDVLRDVVDDRGTSDLLPYVADLSHQLVARFGPPSAPEPTRADVAAAEALTEFRGLVNRLPGLAQGLAQAAARWGTPRSDPVLDSSTPIGWRDRSGIERYAGIAPTQVPALAAVAIAERALKAAHQSAVVAAYADRTAMRIGHQPHPHLVKAHIAQAAATPPSVETEPDSPWHSIVAGLDARACRDAAWPILARTLERAARAGWDVGAHLPALARGLPARQPAVELTYRVLECCELPAMLCDDYGPPPGHLRVPTSPRSPAASLMRSTTHERTR